MAKTTSDSVHSYDTLNSAYNLMRRAQNALKDIRVDREAILPGVVHSHLEQYVLQGHASRVCRLGEIFTRIDPMSREQIRSELDDAQTRHKQLEEVIESRHEGYKADYAPLRSFATAELRFLDRLSSLVDGPSYDRKTIN